jgi:hypothetical protein
VDHKIMSNNVVSLESWKSNQQEDKSLKEYLNVLSFHALVGEAEDTMRELNDNSFSPELARKSKQILKEFNNRLGADDDGFAEPLTGLRASIDKKMTEIKGLETL